MKKNAFALLLAVLVGGCGADESEHPSTDQEVAQDALDQAVEADSSSDSDAQVDLPSALCSDEAIAGEYCAGEYVAGGVEGELYRCQGPGAAVFLEACSAGCVKAPLGQNDYCAQAGASCVAAATGDFCGAGAWIENGEAQTLYRCDGSGRAVVIEPCLEGCVEGSLGADYCQQAQAICDVDAATGYYCAGDRVSQGVADTLYFCEGPGEAAVVEYCALGCVIESSGVDDHCGASGPSCESDAQNRYYCAGDKVSGGRADTLYFCQGPGPASEVDFCEDGCVIEANGEPDHCAIASPTCDGDAVTGHYCAGDKVSGGQPDALYYCQGPGAASLVEQCDAGCVVEVSGVDDHCAVVGGASCDGDALTGHYCAGDKVSGGEADSLYYCQGPGEATLVAACDQGCVIAPSGSPDYCAGEVSEYYLPYACGVTFPCSNGNDTSTHTGKDVYAFDFAMPVDSSIRAMRGGVVLRVRIVSTPGSVCYDGGGSSCANLANSVEILHADGTVALYLHINSSSVSEGQVVVRGQEIAKSGNTGWSTGPHLHLQLQEDCGIWWCQSLPLSFVEVAVLSAGMSITSQNCP